MVVSSADDIYAYIQNKTAKLQRIRKGATLRTFALWAFALCLWVADQIGGADALVLVVIASAWSSTLEAISNLHIDLLAGFHRDLDRDSAEGLNDFETPR